jgi:hypothetical protein
MGEYKSLTSGEIAEISGEFYNDRTGKAVQRDKPIITFIAAQPGAGKSAAAKLAKLEARTFGGYIHVDADVMREKIPLADGAKPTSQETQKDAGALANAVRALAIKRRRNIIEEGTFRLPGVLRSAIDRIRALGYQVELLAVATSREESQLGIFQRHERQHADPNVGNPRFVSSEYHNSAMDGFTDNLRASYSDFDRARAIRRDGEILFDSASSENAYKNVYSAVIEGRKMTDEKLVEIAKAWKEVKAQALSRNAPKEYIDEIDLHAQHIEKIQQEREKVTSRPDF